MINQLDLRAGTKGDAALSSSGNTKLAKAIEIKEIGVKVACIRELEIILSIKSWANVSPQVKKHNDS